MVAGLRHSHTAVRHGWHTRIVSIVLSLSIVALEGTLVVAALTIVTLRYILLQRLNSIATRDQTDRVATYIRWHTILRGMSHTHGGGMLLIVVVMTVRAVAMILMVRWGSLRLGRRGLRRRLPRRTLQGSNGLC